MFGNLPQTTVVSGGTTAPAAGTQETWTVASSASFPSASTGIAQFHAADVAANSEIVAVTNVSGTTWTVIRGAEGTTPVAHTAGFTIFQVTTAGFLNSYPNPVVNLLVPGYQYPTVGNLWPQLNNFVPPVKYVIANPASGPGSGDANYTAAINAAVAAGITVLGYVNTGDGSGTPSLATIQTQVNAWNSLYGVTNIFYDNVATSSGALGFYTTAAGYVSGKKVFNHGAMPAVSGYLDLCDIAIVYEDVYANLGNLATAIAGASFFYKYPPSKYAAIVHTIPDWPSAATVLRTLRSDGIANVYLTDQTNALGNPYSVLPSWWRAECDDAVGDIGRYVGLDANGNVVPLSGVFPLNQNWDFESSITPWTGSGGATVAQSTTWAWKGTHSLKATPNGSTSGPAVLSETAIPVAGSTSYVASAMVYVPTGYPVDSSGISGVGAQIGMNWYTSGSVYISTTTSGVFGVSGIASGPAMTPGLVTFTASSPSNAAFAQIFITLNGTPANTVIFYVDDAALYPAASPSAGQVLRSDGVNAFMSPLAGTDLPSTVTSQVAFTGPGSTPSGHWYGAVTAQDVTVQPNPIISQSASLFLDNNNGQVWEFFCSSGGSFGAFNKTGGFQTFGIASGPTGDISLTPGGNVTMSGGAVSIAPTIADVTIGPTGGSVNITAHGSSKTVNLNTTAGDVVLQPTGGAIRLHGLANQMQSQQWVRTSVNHAASPYSVSSSADYIIGCDPTAGTITVNLPALGYDAQAYIIKDETGQAAINAITVQCSGHTIDGASTFVIGQAYGAALFYSIGSNWASLPLPVLAGGANDAEQFACLSGTYTLAANTSAQALFNVPSTGVLTVAATTTYFFELEADLTSLSGSSHTLSLGFATGGGASITSMKYVVDSNTGAAGTLAAWQSAVVTTNAATAITAAVTTTTAQFRARGVIRVNAGGTLTPQITQGTNGAAAVIAANSYFRCWPVGSNTVTTVGSWA